MGEIRVLKTIGETRAQVLKYKKEGKIIGLVPTMGYFHEGHINLMRKARKECDVVFVSLFVNPIQFGPKEDLASYPRDLEHDIKMASKADVDYIFFPEVSEMYPERFQTKVTAGELSKDFCGASRAGHFDGVCTVVSKLFNIMTPDFAYFGMKDYQQLVIIEKMVEDLNFGIKIRRCEITRESDGLAMSSRNTYLTPDERSAAPQFQKSLKALSCEIIEAVKCGKNLNLNEAVNRRCDEILAAGFKKVDYLKIADAQTLNTISNFDQLKKSREIFIAGAMFIGKTRLIDNIVFEI